MQTGPTIDKPTIRPLRKLKSASQVKQSFASQTKPEVKFEKKKLKNPFKLRVKNIRVDFDLPKIEPEVRPRWTIQGEKNRIAIAKAEAKKRRAFQEFLMAGQAEAEKHRKEMGPEGLYYYYGKIPNKKQLKETRVQLKTPVVDKETRKLMKNFERMKRLTPDQWKQISNVLGAQIATGLKRFAMLDKKTRSLMKDYTGIGHLTPDQWSKVTQVLGVQASEFERVAKQREGYVQLKGGRNLNRQDILPKNKMLNKLRRGSRSRKF